ncbi:MAG: hypothetical protein L6M37_00070 [Candidatus Methylarchaceae archaeon HK02M1]|nr:hypothetical protein [Candidatus Methylarchaceae archaeon HK01M]MCP8311333.1 hypothetical protein [Candidatus Methylarchaceae archaeon HK02M1]
MVDEKKINEIKKMITDTVVKDSPEFKGIEPTIKIIEPGELVVSKKTTDKLGLSEAKTKKEYKFSFRKKVIAEDGAEIPIVVHVTTDEKGKIIRYTGN